MSLMSKCHCQVISSITTINNIKNPILNKWKHFTEGSVSWFSIFVMSKLVISMLGIIVVYDLNIEIPKCTSSYRGSIYNVIDVRDNRGLRLIKFKNIKVYMYTYSVDMCICNHAAFWSTVYELLTLYIRQTIQPWKIASFHLWSCRVYKPYFERDCIAHVQLIVENRYLLDKDNWVKPENKC